MRIVLATQWFPPDTGGVSSHVRDLALKLVEKGHEVTVITRHGRGLEGVDTVWLRRGDYVRFPASLAGSGELAKLLRELDPDVVHSHHAFTPIPLMALATASSLEYPTILTNHSAYLNGYEHLLRALGSIALPIKALVSRADEIVAVSRAAAEFIQAFAPRRSVKVIPNGVDVEKFNPRGATPLRDTLASEFIVLFVGRLVWRKGLLQLVKAIALLDDVNATLIVVGEGPLRWRAEVLAETLGVRDRTVFLGRVRDSELPGIYRSADVVVVPSVYGESFGIVALEAMASGRPVVASRVGGLSEVVVDGETGILVQPGSPRSIAEALLALHQDRSLARKLGLNARRIVVERYSWKRLLSKLLETYERLSAGHCWR